MLVDIVGYQAGLFLALCFLPQVMRTYRLKQAREVSLVMLLMSLVSACLYEVYAYYRELTPVLIMNAVFLILNLIVLILKLAYDRNGSKKIGVKAQVDA